MAKSEMLPRVDSQAEDVRKILVDLALRYGLELEEANIESICELYNSSEEAKLVIRLLVEKLEINVVANDTFQKLCDLLSTQVDDLEQDNAQLRRIILALKQRMQSTSTVKVTGKLKFFSDQVVNDGVKGILHLEGPSSEEIDAWLKRFLNHNPTVL